MAVLAIGLLTRLDRDTHRARRCSCGRKFLPEFAKGAILPEAATPVGRVRALVVTGPRCTPELPNVPTAAEAGLPGFEVTAWFGPFAPAKTPRPIVDRLNAEIVKILAMPEHWPRYSGGP